MKRNKIRFASGDTERAAWHYPGTGMREVELSAGTIEYVDTAGDGPVLVLAARADDGRVAVG